MTIDADSLDTDNETRDRHLRSERFFDVVEHPQVRFSSTLDQRELGMTVSPLGTLHVKVRLTPDRG